MAKLSTSALIFVILFYLYKGNLGVRHKAFLSPDYAIIWEVINQDSINFGAIVNTTGWVGLGLNTKPKMDGADLVMVGIKNDNPYLYNYHAIGHRPILEEKPHWTIGYGRCFETNNKTYVNIHRLLDTGSKDGHVIEDKEIFLLWSYGEDDDVNKRHIDRGVIKVNLLNPKVAPKTRN